MFLKWLILLCVEILCNFWRLLQNASELSASLQDKRNENLSFEENFVPMDTEENFEDLENYESVLQEMEVRQIFIYKAIFLSSSKTSTNYCEAIGYVWY